MKKFVVGIILLALLVPTFAWAQETPVTEEKPNSVEKIREAVRNYTPDFITKPIFYVVNKLETFRTTTLTLVEVRRMNTKNELADKTEMLESDPGREYSGVWAEIIDAAKYLEIFVLFIVGIVFEIKLLFYGVIFILLLILSRFFWYRFY